MTGQVGAAVLAVLSFWVLVFMLPQDGAARPVQITGAVLLGLAMISIWPLYRFTNVAAGSEEAGTTSSGKFKERITEVGAVALAGYLVLLLALWLCACNKVVVFNLATKLYVGIGGSAIASFVIGLLLFRTLRSAASLPIVILFVAVATFPGDPSVATLNDLRTTLITWMGVIIGASAVAEGAAQVASTIQKGRVASQVVAAAGGEHADQAGALRDAVLPVMQSSNSRDGGIVTSK